MRPRITNIERRTCDVHNLSFESAGALALVNEYSGFAVTPAHYIAFAAREHRTSPAFTLALREVNHEPTIRH
jgi:hypothetical protein